MTEIGDRCRTVINFKRQKKCFEDQSKEAVTHSTWMNVLLHYAKIIYEKIM